MLRSLPLLAALILVLGTGLLHGFWTNRWLRTDEPQATAARLDALPLDIGDWHGTDAPINASILALGEIVNYKQRSFVDLRTRAEFNALVVCGKPGPISVHTPDICFPGAGYRMMGEPHSISLELGNGLPNAEFKTARFQRQNSTDNSEMQAFWAWSTDGQWLSPAHPRWTFGSAPALFKVYIIFRVLPKSESPEEQLNKARDFMLALTKVVQTGAQDHPNPVH